MIIEIRIHMDRATNGGPGHRRRVRAVLANGAMQSSRSDFSRLVLLTKSCGQKEIPRACVFKLVRGVSRCDLRSQ